MHGSTEETRPMGRSAIGYTSVSLAVTAAFVLLALWRGGYPLVALYGGAIWTFLLSMIVSMPLVTSRFARRAKG